MAENPQDWGATLVADEGPEAWGATPVESPLNWGARKAEPAPSSAGAPAPVPQAQQQPKTRGFNLSTILQNVMAGSPPAVDGPPQPAISPRRRELLAEREQPAVTGDMSTTAMQIALGLEQGFHSLGASGNAALQYFTSIAADLPPATMVPGVSKALRGESEHFRQVAATAARKAAEVGELRQGAPGEFAGTVASGAVSIGPTLAVAPAGFPAMVAVAGLQQFGSTFQEAQESFQRQGVDPETAAKGAVIPAIADGVQTALITAAFGKTGVEALGQAARTPGFQAAVSRIVRAGAAEAPEEGLNQAVSAVVRALHDPEALSDPKAIVAEVLEAAAVGGILGVGATSAFEAAAPARAPQADVPGRPAAPAPAPKLPLARQAVEAVEATAAATPAPAPAALLVETIPADVPGEVTAERLDISPEPTAPTPAPVPEPESLVAETAQGSRPGPMLLPLPPATPQAPKAISQVIRDLSSGLLTPIRFGRLLTRKFGGYFLPKQNLIGSKFANDIVVVSHEVGHKVDSVINLKREPAIQSEILDLGDPGRPGSMSSWTPSKTVDYRRGEGVAEFMRLWLTDPDQAAAAAPNTTAFFEGSLANLPDLSNVLRQAREDLRLWRSAEPQARLRSHISVGEGRRTRYTLSNLTSDLVDDLHFVRLASDDVGRLRKAALAPSKDPYIMARLLRGTYGVADTFINAGPVDFTTREVSGAGLRAILEPIGPRIADFRDYIVARQAQEMRRQGKETGLVPSDVDFVVSKFANDQEFNQAFDALKKWSDSFLTYAVNAGYISEDSAKAMRRMNQEYVPFHRVFEIGAGEVSEEGQGASGRGLNAVKAIKGRKGSRRDIVDPLETYIKNAYAVLLNSDKNALNIALADLAHEPSMGRWVEPIATPKEVDRVTLSKVREQLEDAGADVSAVPDDLLLTFFKDSSRAPSGENIIKVNRAGKLEFYRLNSDLYRTIQGLDQESAGALLKILAAPAQLLRAGATLTPDFAVSNAMRDTVAAAVLSRYGVFPLETTLKGLYALLRNPKVVNEWKASGGAQAVEAHYFDRRAVQNFLRHNISKDFSFVDYVKFIGRSPLTALRVLSGTLEEATRIGEFQRVFNRLIERGYDVGEARRLAAYEARDLQDFAMGGAKTKSLRRVTAFWNAALQGNYRLYRSLKDPKTRDATVLKGIAWVTVPTLALFAINQDDRDYWDRPQWERDLFWLIPRGKDSFGHTKFLRVPKPFEIGLIFGTVPERALKFWRDQDPEAFKDLRHQMFAQTLPNPIPQPIVTLFNAFLSGERGYDLFRGRPIVPQSMEDFPPELQVTEQTSITARRLGKTLGLSPLKIDFVINQTGGGLARQAVHQGVDRVLSWLTGDERTARASYPGARFLGTPSGVSSAAVERFYDRLKVLRQEGKRRDLTGKGDDRGLALAESTSRALAKLRKRQIAVKDETERQKIYLRMRELAERTLERLP